MPAAWGSSAAMTPLEGEKLHRSPPGVTSWSGHWAKAVAVELPLEQSESIADHVGIWGAKTYQWARATDAEPRFLSPALAQAFLQTEQPTSGCRRIGCRSCSVGVKLGDQALSLSCAGWQLAAPANATSR